MWSAPTPAQLKQAIYDHGPLNVTVYVNTAFQAYHEGVFNACESQIINHAVVLVGWDDNQGPEGVWILRNSWGTNWGEGGYMRIAYGCCRVGYAATYVNYFAPDCNSNGIRDEQDLADGTSLDCNLSGAPDECEPGGSTDCNGNGVSDLCDIFTGSSGDCNGNGIPDDCEIASGSAPDCNANGVPDTCELNVLYVLDDGALDSGLGFGEGTGHLIWLNTFIVTPGGETVDAIDVAWGWVTAGTPTTLALWLDPTGDRDPHDARLLWQSAHPVPAADPATDLFTTVLVPPVHVGEPGEVFCVGAYIHADQYPAAFDLSVYPGHAWAAVGKNLAHLDANESLGCLDDWVGRGVWSLRAHTVSGDANGNGVPDECDGRPGDLNCDGRVDNFDITPFVLALASTPPDYPEYYGTYLECQRELADINGDGRVDNFDISPFVSLLIGR
jgi:hypothetical protein